MKINSFTLVLGYLALFFLGIMIGLIGQYHRTQENRLENNRHSLKHSDYEYELFSNEHTKNEPWSHSKIQGRHFMNEFSVKFPLRKTPTGEYTFPLHVGTPFQTIQAVFNTLSSKMKIASSCKLDGNCLGQNSFNPAKSSSTSFSKKTNSTTFPDECNTTSTVSDIVHIKHFPQTNFTFEYFCDNKKNNSNPGDFNAEIGLLPIDVTHENNNSFDNFVAAMFEKNIRIPKVITFWFSERDESRTLHEKIFGEVIFGGDNPAKHFNSFINLPMAEPQTFSFMAEEILVGERAIISGPIKAFLASAIPEIRGPAKDVDALMQALNASQINSEFIIPKDQLSQIPSVVIIAHNFLLDMEPFSFCELKNDDSCKVLFAHNSDPLDNNWYLGIPFLHPCYFIIDLDQNHISIDYRRA